MTSKLLRKIHIYLSLICFSFLFFFCFTAITLNHPKLFATEMVSVQHLIPLTNTTPASIQTSLALKGIELSKIQISQLIEMGELEIASPGKRSDLYYDESIKQIELLTTDYGFITMLNELHQNRHAPEIWLFISDAVACIIMLICVSGIWLSLKQKRQRKLYLYLLTSSVIALIALV
ncbi:PepSY-associated TM helix domain-containing protein [Shewanella eurypsychrophilus]|uniref:PepSY-associated TM helix domain-containing protein n=1 Tax=Shewanella eurypsychrophilus TaxID=2593656 RepID=A0ABX6V6K9_9GAMM|nr:MULTISPECIES: PepSY-associated TM helix domain-containing protein [Shewanella]QFU22196.1 hypothetical protein FS418_10110 [Shewanella sp. YLB-09]QPG57482.1 PepSY-associated TM helix domain-containing protein [Shewanella eurypsychrophilus]